MRSWLVRPAYSNQTWDEVEARSAKEAAELFAEDEFGCDIRLGFSTADDVSAIEVKKSERATKVERFNITARVEVEFEAAKVQEIAK